MLKNIGRIFIYFFTLIFVLVSASTAYTQDYIKNFINNIVVHKNRTVTVTEKIAYVLPYSYLSKRGILRELPTRYKDTYGNNYIVDFKLKEVLKEGRPVKYNIEDYANGKIIKIGDPSIYLDTGEHEYTISYEIGRQLGFFKDYDELFWNVTGQGWRLPILNIKATISLPNDIPGNKIQAKAYTGYFGQQGQDYLVDINKNNNTIQVKTTRTLEPKEGLSVVTIWPKGYINPPNLYTKIYYLFKDNLSYIILLLGIIALLIYYLFYYFNQVKPLREKFTIIPLFYPPDNLTPGELRYIYKTTMDSIVFASDVINLAVMGFLKIEHKEGFFNHSYILTKTDKDIDQAPKYYKRILSSFFEDKDKVILGSKYNKQAGLAWDRTETFLKYNYNKYFDSHSSALSIGAISSILVAIGAAFFASFYISLLFVIGVVVLIVINIIFASIFHGYTEHGYAILSKIKGFKLFLETTETERLKVIGTPPVKTPELYEKYLPYAVALGVEKAWTKKFAPIFENLKNQGIQYQPVWYTGVRTFDPYRFSLISYNFSQALNTTAQISSSTVAPGTSSGWGGGGGAGRGGGGGGGGSW